MLPTSTLNVVHRGVERSWHPQVNSICTNRTPCEKKTLQSLHEIFLILLDSLKNIKQPLLSLCNTSNHEIKLTILPTDFHTFPCGMAKRIYLVLYQGSTLQLVSLSVPITGLLDNIGIARTIFMFELKS